MVVCKTWVEMTARTRIKVMLLFKERGTAEKKERGRKVVRNEGKERNGVERENVPKMEGKKEKKKKGAAKKWKMRKETKLLS